jgi:hypothetical protein
MIEMEMVNQFSVMRERSITSREVRRAIIARNRHYSAVKSNRLCLYCLIRPAQHVTVCDHPFCDLCAQIFGDPAASVEYRFTVERCLYCETEITLTVDVLPPSMDPSVLAIDGGGVRGVIPLEFLILVQEYLGNAGRLQDYVDLVVGSSAGQSGIMRSNYYGTLMTHRGAHRPRAVCPAAVSGGMCVAL